MIGKLSIELHLSDMFSPAAMDPMDLLATFYEKTQRYHWKKMILLVLMDIEVMQMGV